MKRTLDNFQEVGWLSDNGHLVRTTAIAEVSVSIIKKWMKNEEGREIPKGYETTLIFSSARTQETMAIVQQEFTSAEALLDLLGIDEDEEVWEVLE